LTISGTLNVLSKTTPVESLFQHKEVDRAYGGFEVTVANNSDWFRRDLLIQAHQEWKARVQNVTRVINGDWHRVWPDLTREPLAPTVANTIELSTSHYAAIGGSMVPSIRVPVAHAESGPEGERGAQKRARRLRELEEKSNIHKLLANWFGDYAGTGASAAFVWADFSKPPEERNPVIYRLDPRHYYPVVDPQGHVQECLIARKVHSYELKRIDPIISESLNDDSIVEEWFWFEKDRIRHMLVDVSPEGRKDGKGWVLVDVPNDMGVVPVVEITRPSFDGERRGAHDQTIHILRVQHHLMALTIERTEEEVYPPIAGYDVEDLDLFGPGSSHQYRSADGKIDRLTPQSNFDVKDLIARLESQARFQSVYPVQLTGDPGASIASARAITASQGALDARLAQAHRDFEWFLAQVDEMLLRFDEAYCDAPKTIYGDARDRKNPESWSPSRDIAGAYEVTRSYGLGAGADPTNKETRLQLHLSSGLISMKTARGELDFLENEDMEEKQVAKEQMVLAVNQGILARSGQGDTDAALMYFKLLNDPDLTMEEVLEKFYEMEQEKAAEAAAAAQEATVGQGGGDPLQAISSAESLSRGGIPGNAEGLPAGAALPSLPGVLNEGAPAQVA
jgi:hypothetical protein